MQSLFKVALETRVSSIFTIYRQIRRYGIVEQSQQKQYEAVLGCSLCCGSRIVLKEKLVTTIEMVKVSLSGASHHTGIPTQIHAKKGGREGSDLATMR